jgi:hypothetical protein
VSSYLLAGLVIVLANLIPAFAPPTWAILVYFSFGYHLHSIPLILIGVLSATMGRAVLALLFRALAPYLPRGYVTNLENLGSRITTDSRSAMGLFFLFFLSPISSAQLFEAAGTAYCLCYWPHSQLLDICNRRTGAARNNSWSASI